MPRALIIMFLVLAPILVSVTYFRDSAIGETFAEVVVWLTAILLAVIGSYYAWIKPKNRSKRWLIPPVLVVVFIIPLLIVTVKVLVVGEPPSKTSIAIEKLTEVEEKVRGSDFYSLASYADEYESIIRDLGIESHVDWGPGYMFLGDNATIFQPYAVYDGFPPLALFYGECRGLWESYLSLRSSHLFDTYILDALRRKYETNIPELDGVLFLWGKEGNLETDEATEIVIAMMKYYDISPTMVSSLKESYRTTHGKELWDSWQRYGTLRFLNLEGEATNRVKAYGWRDRFGY